MSDGGHDDGENATGRGRSGGKGRRVQRPLDAQQLHELALAYVARFATSAGRLDAYLKRKLRERGWDGDGARAPDHAGVVARMVELGYVDDRGFAQARAGGMMRRGFGARRIGQALARDGIAEDIVVETRGDARAARAAALAFARRRRLGPFGRGSAGMVLDRAVRDKQLAAMLRAGHTVSFARAVIDAADVAALEQWVDDEDG